MTKLNKGARPSALDVQKVMDVVDKDRVRTASARMAC